MTAPRPCVRCRETSDWGLELCRSCYKATRAERKASLPARLAATEKSMKALGVHRPQPQAPEEERAEKKQKLAPRVRSAKPIAWRSEQLRRAVLAGLGEPGSRASIREMRERFPRIVDQYVSGLSSSNIAALRKELAGQGFVGSDALMKFGQKVVSDISQERQASFRGVTSGGLPGSRR
ncbi:hypothetical protein RE9425_03270 [Prescottella equi]|nr:hypothetical protein RE9425_03270 [Prescottella equi]